MSETLSNLMAVWGPQLRLLLNFVTEALFPLIGAWFFANWLIEYLSRRDDT